MSSEDKLSIIYLGAFPQDSIPLPIKYTYKDEEGVKIDMSSGSWTAEAKAAQVLLEDGVSQPTGLGGGSATVVAATAVVTYLWVAADFTTVGTFRMTLWSGNETNRVGSRTYEWEVFDSPGSTPTV